MHRFLALALWIAFLLGAARPVSAQKIDGPIYIVQPGDTLTMIASRFNVPLPQLMSANDISDANQLAAGQQLVIPGLEGITGVLDTELINLGDSYRSLMRRTAIDPALFQKLNRVISPTELYVGAALILPRRENAPAYASTGISTGESLLELAVRQGTDVWTMAAVNGLAGSWDGPPGDSLYSSGSAEGEPAGGLPAAFTSAEISTLPLKQGGTAEIVIAPAAGVSLTGQLADLPLHFFPLNDGSQVSLQGIPALLDPGLYPLRLDAALLDGSRQSYEQMVLVNSGNYLSETIPLNDASTIDPAVTGPENSQIASIVGTPPSERLWNGIFTAPAIYPNCFTSRYGTRRTYKVINSTTEVPGYHSGLDFCGGEGLQITAPAAGRVIFAGPLAVRGNATIIDHGWGVISGFWHQSEIQVQVGQVVEQGQPIGLVGGTGRVTGAHLHWELWVNTVQVDPLDWLNRAFP